MPVTLIEKPDSREFEAGLSSGSGTWRYLARVTGEANPEAAILTAVVSSTGFFWYNLAFESVRATALTSELYRLEVAFVYEPANARMPDPTASPGPTDGPGGTAPSTPPSGPAGGGDRVGPNEAWEGGGTPPRLYSSLDVVYSEKAGGGLAPDNARLLNVNRLTGEVEGLEVPDPAGTYTFSAKVDFVTWAYVERLDGMLWRTNQDTWRTMPPRSYLFMGYSLRTGEDGRVQLDLRFGRSPQEDYTVGQLRADAGKTLPTVATNRSGWDYLELDYEDVFDAAAGLTVKKPVAMRIHQLFRTADFETLGIGG